MIGRIFFFTPVTNERLHTTPRTNTSCEEILVGQDFGRNQDHGDTERSLLQGKGNQDLPVRIWNRLHSGQRYVRSMRAH